MIHNHFWRGYRLGSICSGVIATASLLALAILCGCCPYGGGNPGPWPRPTPTSIPAPRPTPTSIPAPRPTPTAAPAHRPYQVTEGRAVLTIRGIDQLPLSPAADTSTVATMTWETEGRDLGAPVLELQIRGQSAEPCLSRPCRDRAGLVIRYSSSIAHDEGLPERQHCGEGVNYHRRIALGNLPAGLLRVTLEWDRTMLRVSTPVDSWQSGLQEERGFSLGFGRVITGAPFERREIRGWSWKPLLDGSPWIKLSVESWTGSLGLWRECTL